MDYLFLIKATLFLTLIGLTLAGLRHLSKKEPQPRYLYRGKKTIMTKAEIDLYNKLVQAFPTLVFVPQVHLSALFDHKIKGQNWNAAFSHINGKSVDFVALDTHLSVYFAIELDDYTHYRPERIQRDMEVNAIFRSAGVPLIRLNNSLFKTSSQIKKEVEKSLDFLKH